MGTARSITATRRKRPGGCRKAADSFLQRQPPGRSKGFGFVEMGSDEEAQAAINGMNGQPLGGRNLVVNEARPMEPRPPRSGGGGFGGPRGGGFGGGNRGGFGGGDRGGFGGGGGYGGDRGGYNNDRGGFGGGRGDGGYGRGGNDRGFGGGDRGGDRDGGFRSPYGNGSRNRGGNQGGFDNEDY